MQEAAGHQGDVEDSEDEVEIIKEVYVVDDSDSEEETQAVLNRGVQSDEVPTHTATGVPSGAIISVTTGKVEVDIWANDEV